MKRSNVLLFVFSIFLPTVNFVLIVTTSRLLQASKVKKAMPKGGDAVVQSTEKDDVQYPCLVRATYKKNKISTIV
jgi:hypothetical protein